MGPRLDAGQELRKGDRLDSIDLDSQGRPLFFLIFQGDSNLVLYQNGRGENNGITYIWASWTQGRQADRVVMQGDGNFVMYDGLNPIWNTGTDRNPGAWIQLQGDGNLVIYTPPANPIWTTSTDAQKWTLYPGQILLPGVALLSGNSQFQAIYQGDGNFVLYDISNGTGKWIAKWSSGTQGTSLGFVKMEHSGDLIVYDSSRTPVWRSGANVGGASLIVDDNGILKTVANGTITWSVGWGSPPLNDYCITITFTNGQIPSKVTIQAKDRNDAFIKAQNVVSSYAWVASYTVVQGAC